LGQSLGRPGNPHPLRPSMVPCIRRYWTVAAIAGLLLAPASVSAQTILASTSAAQVQTPGSQIPPSVPAEAPSFGRFEISHYGNFVSNNLGQWYGGGLHLFLTPSPRVSLIGEAVYQRRPGEIEELGSFSATFRADRLVLPEPRRERRRTRRPGRLLSPNPL
jgi:hypothetical protein